MFRRLYHEFAWCYDLVAVLVSGGHWRHWICAVVPFLGQGRVLELGCGTGYLQRELARLDVPHAGYDASREMLRHASRRVNRASFEPRLVRGIGQQLPFPDAAFTDVVATFPAPYILDPATLVEARRVLRPGGQMVIVDGGRLEDRGIYAATVEAAFKATLQQDEGNRYEPALREAGFAVEVTRVGVGNSSVAVVRARPI